MRRSEKVTVVIPTRNRQKQLEACLASVEKSDYTDIEVVVVDDFSNQSVVIAPGMGRFRVRLVRNPSRKLLSYSRNLGATMSSGDFIFFLDDDNQVETDTVSELVKTFDLAQNVVVSCPVIYFANRKDGVWTSDIRKGRLPGFYILGSAEPTRPVRTFSFHNSFMVKREVFFRLGGFDHITLPMHIAELDFAYRLSAKGYSAIVNPRAKVWHDVAKSHMHVDSSRSYYTLRNRIILLRRYESSGTYWAYVLGMLPALTFYYVVHHLTSSSDRRLLGVYNLLRGVVAALAMRGVTKPSSTETPVKAPDASKESVSGT